MKTHLSLIAASLTLSACAALGPSNDEINQLPIVSFGSQPPAQGDFVLRYPAGAELPIAAKVNGNLFAQTAQAPMQVRLKQDVYVYRDRVSLDGKHWTFGPHQVGTHIRLSLPGLPEGKPDATSPGELSVEFNQK